jgi:hypothetical protein
MTFRLLLLILITALLTGCCCLGEGGLRDRDDTGPVVFPPHGEGAGSGV